MERRTRVLVACLLFTAALLFGNGRWLIGAVRPSPGGNVALLPAAP